MDLSQNMSIDNNDFEDNLEDVDFQVDKERHKSNNVVSPKTIKTELKSKSTKKNFFCKRTKTYN